MSPFPSDSYLSLFTHTCLPFKPFLSMWSLSTCHSPLLSISPLLSPLFSPCSHYSHFHDSPFSPAASHPHLPIFRHFHHSPHSGSSPALRRAPTAPAGQPVSHAKRLRTLPPPSFLPSASATTASASQPEPELWWGLLRGPGPSTSSIPAAATGPGSGPVSGPTPAAPEHRGTAPRPTGRPAYAPGPQIHRQLRRLLLGLSAIQRT